MEMLIERVDEAFHLRATAPSGNTVETDLTVAGGGSNKGVSPLELLLVALGACSGVDVISILEKGRQRVDTFRIQVNADRDGGKPISMITDLYLVFELEGELEPARVRRAVELSLDTYCTVSRVLSATARISATYTVNGTHYDADPVVAKPFQGEPS